jgi:putative membrane-bound dehydrogenase-like protein
MFPIIENNAPALIELSKGRGCGRRPSRSGLVDASERSLASTPGIDSLLRLVRCTQPRSISSRLGLALVSASLFVAASVHAADFPNPYNTQKEAVPIPSPAEAVRKMTLPPGFKATVFAAEPDIRQPIHLTTDTRGRLWVAECYTYAESKVNYAKDQRDRIVILEDTDGDGRHDKRTVFWDKADKLTSVEVGFGGVWALCAPKLLFIPDKNGDDVPDGEPVVILDGWEDNTIRHNIVNGLKWGPDGWLYGRHGIQATSSVGKPGTPDSARVKLNCAIWRYHPVRGVFEVVCQGGTNSWGHDWDEHGQLFFINTVIGHFWHGIPGAYYKRMYGEHLRPHLYELIDQHADHYHWDTKEQWGDIRKGVTGTTSTAGGGHAHTGFMIYLGDNWPDKYRNTAFSVNIHGLRINNDRMERQGSGYVAKHNPDFMLANDPWFRAVELIYGPDGGVFVADWTDMDECHDNDGVHRTSGRIYKITYGDPKKPAIADVAKLSDAELVKLQLHKNDWYVRQSRHVLQQRAAAGQDMKATHTALRKMFDAEKDVTRKLRAMWTLFVTGGADEKWLQAALAHPDEHTRTWAIKLLCEEGLPSGAVLRRFTELTAGDPSPFVRLALASMLHKFPPSERTAIGSMLAAHPDRADHNLPWVLWAALEPRVAEAPAYGVELAMRTQIGLLRRFSSRRIAENSTGNAEWLDELLKLASSRPPHMQKEVLQGIAEGLQGVRKAARPASWYNFVVGLGPISDGTLVTLIRELGVVFGDGRALDEVRKIALDGKADGGQRRAALQSLIDAKPEDLSKVLQNLVSDRVVAGVAVRGMASFDEPRNANLILAQMRRWTPDDQRAGVDTLASRPSYAKTLLAAVEDGRIARSEVTAAHARQIRSFGDDALSQQLAKVWGDIRGTPEEKQKLLAKYQAALTPETLKRADAAKGRELFNLACASCHALFGQGASIGPDLTGGDRRNLHYLLENLIDPSAMVPADFKMSVITLKDGRVLNGVITSKTDRTLTIQLPTEKLTLERSEVTEARESALSLMPDGLLEAMNEQQARDLIAYLMSPGQVALPVTSK